MGARFQSQTIASRSPTRPGTLHSAYHQLVITMGIPNHNHNHNTHTHNSNNNNSPQPAIIAITNPPPPPPSPPQCPQPPPLLLLLLPPIFPTRTRSLLLLRLPHLGSPNKGQQHTCCDQHPLPLVLVRLRHRAALQPLNKQADYPPLISLPRTSRPTPGERSMMWSYQGTRNS